MVDVPSGTFQSTTVNSGFYSQTTPPNMNYTKASVTTYSGNRTQTSFTKGSRTLTADVFSGSMGAMAPSGNLSLNTTTNWYNPFVYGTTNYTISGTPNGNVPVYTLSGYGSFSQAGNVFQTGQYNSQREGGGR